MNFGSIRIFFFSLFLMLTLTICALFHIHGVLAWEVSAVVGAILAWLTSPWWTRVFKPMERPDRSFHDPSLGSRAARRRAAKDYRSKKRKTTTPDKRI